MGSETEQDYCNAQWRCQYVAKSSALALHIVEFDVAEVGQRPSFFFSWAVAPLSASCAPLFSHEATVTRIRVMQ
jgi:hypothetical protein